MSGGEPLLSPPAKLSKPQAARNPISITMLAGGLGCYYASPQIFALQTRIRCSCDTQYSASSESPSPIAVACLWACSLAYTAWALAPALPARALSPADGPPRLSARAASATLAPFFLRVNLAEGTSPNPKDPKARSNAGSPPGCAAAGWLGKEAGPREEERA